MSRTLRLANPHMRFGNPVIGACRKLEPSAQGVSVKNRDHGLSKPGKAFQDGVAIPNPVAAKLVRPRSAPRVNISARAKGAALATEEHCPNRVIALDPAAKPCQRLEHGAIKRIPFLRPVQPQLGNCAGTGQQDQFRHAQTLSPIGSGQNSLASISFRTGETPKGMRD